MVKLRVWITIYRTKNYGIFIQAKSNKNEIILLDFAESENEKFYIKIFPHVNSYKIVKFYWKFNKVHTQPHTMNMMGRQPQLLK